MACNVMSRHSSVPFSGIMSRHSLEISRQSFVEFVLQLSRHECLMLLHFFGALQLEYSNGMSRHKSFVATKFPSCYS